MKPKHPRGFSLIELMIVVAIIGVLSSIAVPAYRNYIFKAKTSELISYAGAQAKNVSLYLTEQGTAALTASSCSTIPNNSGSPGTAITATWAISAACVVTAVSQSNVIGSGTLTITLTPTLQADGSISWACTSGGSQYAPSNCQ